MTPRSDAVVILKPDVLVGPHAECPRPVARDAVRGLVDIYTGRPPGPYEVETSGAAVRWARRNVDRKTAARSWYDKELNDPREHLDRLGDFLGSPSLAGESGVPTADLVLGMTDALGFQVGERRRRRFTHRDVLGLYAHNTHYTRLAGDLTAYLSGKEGEILLLEGDQSLSSLHILKEVVRRVVRYPTTHYDALENLLHVSDPGATDWVYFEGVMAEDGEQLARLRSRLRVRRTAS
ncbi:hypothetical protein ABZO31_26690 [Streptomyces sp. HUAS MG47]|uniref:hypothetical protein n=1 Tax=Streptomyces solicamelliae TaxID=3231716 RepID=UPI003877D5E4